MVCSALKSSDKGFPLHAETNSLPVNRSVSWQVVQLDTNSAWPRLACPDEYTPSFTVCEGACAPIVATATAHTRPLAARATFMICRLSVMVLSLVGPPS